MRIIIAGGRDFTDYNLLKKICKWYITTVLKIEDKEDVEILSGVAKGADTLAVKFAEELEYKLVKYPADWNGKGKSAGILRNIEMANNADVLIAFWDGKSKGTEHMINTAKRLGLNTTVVNYDKKQEQV